MEQELTKKLIERFGLLHGRLGVRHAGSEQARRAPLEDGFEQCEDLECSICRKLLESLQLGFLDTVYVHERGTMPETGIMYINLDRYWGKPGPEGGE